MAKSSRKRIAWTICGGLVAFVFFLGGGICSPSGANRERSSLFALQDDPAPTVDPFTVPEMPENPTQLDNGRLSYFYNCMPCHGDQGQGLTDAFRETWEEDHQNCWARGCHGGRVGEEGFPIPTVVPAVAGATGALEGFISAKALHRYLQEIHPPQNPGVLPEAEYWALTAFLLHKNGRLSPGAELGPEAIPTLSPPPMNAPATETLQATASDTMTSPTAAPTGAASPAGIKTGRWILALAFAVVAGTLFISWIQRRP